MENFIVSARKYRPDTFESVVGQKALTQTLKNAVQTGKLAHAYLFCGPRGVGKTTCARIFAKTINCFNPTAQGESCHKCESCLAFDQQRSFNISELDAASNNSVDDIRQLTEQVRIAPQIGRYKVYIIDEVHMLTTQAFNAFLKTLEEPPAHAVFILATTEKHKIIPTILSRCQIYDFHRIRTVDIVDHLLYVARQEGVEAEIEALNVIAQKADGGMRDALSVFDQVISFTRGKITYKAVIENLNVLDYDYYFQLTEMFLSNNVHQALLVFDQILSKGFDAQYFVGALASHFRDLLVCQDSATASLLEVGPSVGQRYIEQAVACSTPFLFRALELANQCDQEYRLSRNKRLLVELLLVRLCSITQPPLDQQPRPGLLPVAPAQQQQQQQQASVPQIVSSSPKAMESPTPTPQSVKIDLSKASVTKTQSVVRPSISISKRKESVKEGSNTMAVEMDVKRNNNTPFDADQLDQAWQAFQQTIMTETLLLNTMRSCLPQMLGNFQLQVVVDNPLQMERFHENKPDILAFLRKQLKNDFVEIQVRESLKEEKKKILTSKEKFDMMRDKNDSILTLAQQFGLELE